MLITSREVYELKGFRDFNYTKILICTNEDTFVVVKRGQTKHDIRRKTLIVELFKLKKIRGPSCKCRGKHTVLG